MAHRTQITLTDAQYERLRRESQRTGMSLAELIRRAVGDVYGELTREEKLEIIERTAGLWADRTDLPGTEEYVRQLRGPGMGARLEQIGLDGDR